MHRIVATAIAWVLLAATAGAQSPGSITGSFLLGVGIERYGSFAACTPTSSGLRCP